MEEEEEEEEEQEMQQEEQQVAGAGKSNPVLPMKREQTDEGMGVSAAGEPEKVLAAGLGDTASLESSQSGKKRARASASASATSQPDDGALYGAEEFLLLSAHNMSKSEGARRAVEAEVEALLGEGRRRGPAALAAAAAVAAGGDAAAAAAAAAAAEAAVKPKLKWGQRDVPASAAATTAAAGAAADADPTATPKEVVHLAKDGTDGSGGRDEGADFEPYTASPPFFDAAVRELRDYQIRGLNWMLRYARAIRCRRTARFLAGCSTCARCDSLCVAFLTH